MCDSRIGKFFASIGGYFSAPTFGKAAPAYVASAAPALGIKSLAKNASWRKLELDK